MVASTLDLLGSLDISFIGGGMVSDVRETSFDLVTGDPGSLLEPGLQAWGEIIALGAAITWMGTVRPGGQSPTEHVTRMSERLFDGLAAIPGLTLVNTTAAPVISMYARGQDSHRLAVFLSQ